MNRRTTDWAAGLLCACVAGCGGGAKNEVIVMGMIHGQHRTNKLYSVERVQQFVRAIDPDYVLCEIPPDRLDRALSEFRDHGTVEEPRVKLFPEYVEAVFPLTREMRFHIVPCAAWTREMADARREKMASYERARPAEWAEMTRAEAAAQERLKQEGLDRDPLKIHTDRYDAIVKRGLEPYNRLFNDDLGPGGWDNINRAHYKLIASALDRHKGEGKRFLIMFGAWHKYWLLERLRLRDDITLRSLAEFVER